MNCIQLYNIYYFNNAFCVAIEVELDFYDLGYLNIRMALGWSQAELAARLCSLGDEYVELFQLLSNDKFNLCIWRHKYA